MNPLLSLFVCVILCVVVVVVVLSFWLGTSEAVFANDKLEVVIARYAETESLYRLVRFLQRSLHPTRYLIYNKGSTNINAARLQIPLCYVEIIRLPNVGRCDHTYLHHIVQNYDCNGLAPMTVFLSATALEPHKQWQTRCLVHLLRQGRISASRGAFVVDTGGQTPQSHYGFAPTHHLTQTQQNQQEYGQTHLFPATLRPYEKWYHHHFGDLTLPFVNFQSLFAVTNTQICYETLLQELSVHANPELGHYIERSSISIFRVSSFSFRIRKNFNLLEKLVM